jgi:tetratricopeptide (TPR) repeat protein
VIDAENAGAFLARGFAYYRIGQSPMAMLDFQRAVQLGGPLLPVALAARGLLLCKSGDGRKGMAEFGRAIKLDKTNGLVYLLRANAFSNDGKFLSAVQDFKMAIQLNAQDAEPHRQLAHMQATCPKTEVRNGKKAVTSAKLACDLTAGTDWRCLDTLAAAQAETGDYGEAVKTSDRAAELAEGKNRNLCLKHKKLFESRQPLRLEDAAAR